MNCRLTTRGKEHNQVTVLIRARLSMDNISISSGTITRERALIFVVGPNVKDELLTIKSGCWKTSSLLKMHETSELEVVEVPQLLLSECWISGPLPIRSKRFLLHEVWVAGFNCCTFFVFKKRPPEPLALRKAWRWRDSWRYRYTIEDMWILINEFILCKKGLPCKWFVIITV